MKYYLIIALLLLPIGIQSQDLYNHPEIQWKTIETEHFKIHFYDDTEILAREAAGIMEYVYPRITDLYKFEPKDKTHIIFTDTGDISNGLTYYYENKMVIWASPLDIALRGSHKWLENVLTHEYTHIITIQKAMKAGRTFPGAYLQWIGYEEETHKNVLYGYPNVIMSYPIPGVTVPPWLAEGTAQYMYQGADWDNWDSHRDMLLRDRALHNNLLTFSEINTFGKCGIGNESVYNTGHAFVKFISDKFGPDILRQLMIELSKPFNFSVDKTIERLTGFNGRILYEQFSSKITAEYEYIIESLEANENNISILVDRGTTNLYPKWSNDGKKIAYISNKENDYFGQTDLFIYDIQNNSDKKIAQNIHSGATWGSQDSIIYYSKKPLIHNSRGYQYYDIYSYNIKTEKEKRLTTSARSISPVYIETINSIVYIAMENGKQSLFLYSIADKSTKKIIDFADNRILHSLYYDNLNNRLLFDYTIYHFRNVAYLNLENFEYHELLNSNNIDERNVCISNKGKIIYSEDISGIFNIIETDSVNTRSLTNVTGGAFMPDVNNEGQIIFSLYRNGGYKIAIIDSSLSIDTDKYSDIELNFQKPINRINDSVSENYQDNFGKMFIIPRLMFDYGTVKPGLYFYSSEVLDKLSLNGVLTINSYNDIDFGFNLAFRKLYPTIYTDFMYSTRNTVDKTKYSVYDIDDQLKFRFILMQLGLQIPFYGSEPLDIYTRWQRYRSFVKENIDYINLESGYAYDYFRGLSFGLKYGYDNVKITVDRNINPSKGFKLFTNINYEMNDFINGLNLSDSGTLIEDFAPNNYLAINSSCTYYITLSHIKRWTLAITANGGWISNKKVDPFFNYFGGGLDGLQGYPYYSFEGTNSIFSEISLRVPIFRLKHIPIAWTIWQNATFGIEYQIGDTWTDSFSLKQSIGLQFRINGFSFYNYPTAIGFEVHRGITEFEIQTDDSVIKYGGDNRYYLSILFGF